MTCKYCNDCSKEVVGPKADRKDWYMVHAFLWDQFGLGRSMVLRQDLFLCWGCMEERLGRKMKKSDLSKFPVNDFHRERLKQNI